MPNDTFEFYVREANKVKTIRQDTLDEIINLIVDTRNSCFCNSLIQIGYSLAKEDLVKAVKKLKRN